MQTKITTERLSLSMLALDDCEFILELVNTVGWITFIGDRNVRCSEDAITYINKISGTPDLIYWSVRIRERRAPIGIITFLKRNYLEHFDIGFAFLPGYHGKGYAYEAAREVLLIVNRIPEYKTVLAVTIPENERSVKLLTKLGFHFEKQIKVGKILHVYSNGAGLMDELNSH